MQTHGPKRVYTPKSLEFWFGKFEEDWAGHFSAEELELGRQIYRDGAVREVELGAQDAIIHRRVDKRDEYAVIEWEEMKPVVRSSSTDILWAHALAVAGLHEIEELVADEISPIPVDINEAAGANGNGTGTIEPVKRKESVQETPARRFVLCLKASTDGLLCEAFWDEGRARTPAYGGSAQSLTTAERSKMIGLAAYARKAHFKFSQETHAYVLEAVREIPEFLKTSLPVWEKHFAVEIDPTIKNLQQGVRQVEVEAHAGRSTARGGINMRWVFRAGEKMLTETEVRAISARHGQQVILPHVGIVTLASEKWESVVNWRKTVGEYHGGALPPFLIFSLFNDARWKVSLTPEIEAWRRKVLGTPVPPSGLPDLLRPYQRKGVEWMNHLAESDCHGLLADEMGLGKTIQVLSLLAARPMEGRQHVIVCPASVVPVWREEAARFFPGLKLDVLKAGHDFVTNPEPVIWLASYTQLRKHRALLDKAEFGYAILDEGQFIKNPDAKVTRACFAIRAAHRLVLTGTPLENRQLDLWSIFRFLLPGLLGSRATFEAALLKDREGTIDRLRLQIAPFVLRRTKDEVAKELPPKVVMDLHCPLTELQRTEYGRICEEGMQRLGSDLGAAMRDRSFGFFALLTRLRQACCDPDLLPWIKSDVGHSGKLNLLVEKLGEVLSSGHKVVIFSQFVMFLDRVREVLGREFPDVPRFELTGVTLDRQKPVQGFQSVEGPAVILVSLKAAGTGITLHAADYVFLMDPWWNPAVEDQAVDRVHRIGQTNTVFVYRLVTEGTIEERIQDLKAEKRALFDQIVGNFRTEFNISDHFSSLESLIKLASVPEPDAENGDSNGDNEPNGDSEPGRS
jgi:superfamily II DNA or RNA helicase